MRVNIGILLQLLKNSKACGLALLLTFTATSKAELLFSSSASAITITGSNPQATGDLIIPSLIDGLPVTSIAASAFSGYIGLTTVTLPSSLTSIGNQTFWGCTGLKSVTIPNSVNSIGSYAFRWCSGLTSVTIPSSVTSIGNSAFYGCSGLTSVTLQSGVPSISPEMFYGCTGLTSVTIPNSVTSIGHYAFRGCSGLRSVALPSSVTSISREMFYECSGLTNFTVEVGNPLYTSTSGVLFNKAQTSLLNYPAAKTGDYTVPSSVTSIGEYAFFGCEGLTSVTIPSSVTSINYAAFWGCTGLTSVIIPSSVTSIGSDAFSGCKGLTSVTLPSSITSIGESAFSRCSGLTSVTLPSSITSIGEWAFQGCTGLTSVTLPSSITSIGVQAFSGCSGLTSVTLPSSVTYIGYSAFGWCSGMTNFTVEVENPLYTSTSGVLFNKAQTSLLNYPAAKTGDYTVPSSVTFIDSEAFYGCTGLMNITVDAGNLAYTSTSGVLFNKAQTTLLNYPAGKKGDYTISSSVTSINYGAFAGCTGLTSVTIPNSVTSIGNNAFSECSILTNFTVEVGNPVYTSTSGVLFNKAQTSLLNYPAAKTGDYTIPSSVTSIRQYAFSGCTGLTSVTLPDRVTTIDYYAFYGCTGLTSVTISGIRSIEGGAFMGCTGLTNVTISGIRSIGGAAFMGCTGLTAVYFWGDAPSISQNVFLDSPNVIVYYISDMVGWGSSFAGRPTALWSLGGLSAVINGSTITITGSNPKASGDLVIPSTISGLPVTSIGTANDQNGAFQGCTGLTSVTIPSSVTSIGKNAFRGCTGLTSVTLPSSVTSIGEMAFSECKLTSVTIPIGVKSIFRSTFFGCSRLTSVTLPSSLTSIGPSAFSSCTGLKSVTLPDKVTYIGPQAFLGCSGLTNFTVEVGNPAYTSTSGVLFNKAQTTLLNYPAGKKGDYSIPNSVTSIGYAAFTWCTGLTSVTLPSSITSIAGNAFEGCTGLTSIRFLGDAPSLPSYFSGTFVGVLNATVYYISGKLGWRSTFGGLPTALWVPVEPPVGPVNTLVLQATSEVTNPTWTSVGTNRVPSIGAQQFYRMRDSVVEVALDLKSPAWTPVATNNLPSSGSQQFYRLVAQ